MWSLGKVLDTPEVARVYVGCLVGLDPLSAVSGQAFSLACAECSSASCMRNILGSAAEE